MAMTCLNNQKNDSLILSTIDELVPSDHKVRKLEEAIDWTFIYPLVRPLYSSFGRPISANLCGFAGSLFFPNTLYIYLEFSLVFREIPSRKFA